MGLVEFISPRIGGDWSISCRNHKPISLLRLARVSNVPLPFNCHNGVCGTCAVRVAPDGQAQQLYYTTFEKETLRGLGKLPESLSKGNCKEWKKPCWRLACQFIVSPQAQYFVAF